MKIRIKRQDTPESEPYWQTFDYECDSAQTVAAILDQLNYRDDLTDETGTPRRRIRWECSCMQKICGSCAMIINHVPALACGTFINPAETQQLVLEPLTKFPVISDLTIDRSSIYQHQKEAMMYLGQRGTSDTKEFPIQYQAAKCLKCGLCLEVCPNYTGNGNRFYGAVLANEAYLLHSSTKDRKKEIKKQYNRHFAAGCSQSLACRDICPMKTPTLSSIGYMNR
ncbi:MAG: 2Fe-2S iron-sulfur cluster-binding protein [Suilimivivens sp.]